MNHSIAEDWSNLSQGVSSPAGGISNPLSEENTGVRPYAGRVSAGVH
ncbi:hypothetical protein PQR67_06745 [Paraburkholderia fungorum]